MYCAGVPSQSWPSAAGTKTGCCATFAPMANTNGGTIYIGVSDVPKEPPVGVREHRSAIEQLYTAVSNRITPKSLSRSIPSSPKTSR
ncbi:MAG: ATP-binding protein [Chloroflexi bacterium]|nr:ATP-binding protein [Chloroflexota bacterium]